MAKLNHGPLGTFSGKIGNIVGYMYRGQQCIRSLSSKVPPPPSEAQKFNRTVFTRASDFIKPIGRFLNDLPFDSRASAARSVVARTAVMRVIERVEGRLFVRYPEVILCEGIHLQLSSNLELTETGIAFNCQVPQWTSVNASLIYFLVYFPELDYWLVKDDFFVDGQTDGLIELHPELMDCRAEVYAIVLYENDKKLARSIYCGSLQPETPQEV